MGQNFKKAKELIAAISEETKGLNLLLAELYSLGVIASVREIHPMEDRTPQVYMLFRADLGEAQ